MDYPHAKTYTELYDLQDLVDRAQALALLGAFENYRTLMAQLAQEYETAATL